MNEQSFLGHINFSADQAIKMIASENNELIVQTVFSALQELLDKYKELKQFNIPIILEQNDNANAPFYEANLDFTELTGVLNVKKLQNKRFNEKEFNVINSCNEKYFSNTLFTEKIVDFGRNFFEQAKEKNLLTQMQLDTMHRYFENFPQIMIELKIFLNYIFQITNIEIDVIFSEDEKNKILDALRVKVEKHNVSLKDKTLLKEHLKREVREVGFSSFLPETKVEKYFDNWFENVYKKGLVNIDKIKNMITKIKPIPNYTWQIQTYKGLFKSLVNFIKEIFGLPIARLTLTGYPETKQKAIITHENKTGIYKNNIVLEMFTIANEVGKLLKITRQLVGLLDIHIDTLAECTVDQIHIYQSHINIEYQICEFMYNFFMDIKKIGVITGKVKMKYFYTYLLQISNRFKTQINTPLHNYVTIHEDELADGIHDKVMKKIHDISVELSGLHMNLTRLEELELKSKS